MSKYIDAERLNLEWQTLKPFGVTDTMIENLKWIVDRQPTIEVSEDCISREWLKSKVYDADNDDLVVDWKDIENAPSVVPQVPSEDCISREFVIEVISDYVNYPTEGDKACAIKDAPSVVPTVRKNRTTAESQTYITEDRDTQILDSWQVHHRNITTVEDEPTTEQSSMVGEWIINEPIESGFGTIFECPYCKHEVEFEPTNYCPNCGAKMRLE